MAHSSKTDHSLPLSELALDQKLTGDQTTTKSLYYGYVPGSLSLSPALSTATYRYGVRDQQTGFVTESETSEYSFYRWFSFDFVVANTNGVRTVQSFKIWLNPDDFVREYPFSTITKVVYPCSPSWILEPSSRGSEMQAVLSAAQYKDTQLDNEITSDDHSGIASFVSRYVHSSVNSDARMSFIVMYKGAVPTAADMRKAVREALESEKDENCNLLDPTGNRWKERLPDLWVDAGFYLFPCYYQLGLSASGEILEKSIVNYRKLYEKVRCLRPNMEPQRVFETMEILQVPGHKLYVIALPVEDNNGPYNTLASLHPTYQALSSIGEAYQYVQTTDSVVASGKVYYVQEEGGRAPVYTYNVLDTSNSVGTALPTDIVVYERRSVTTGYWNTMSPYAKEFAQLLSLCYTVCTDDASIHKKKFTEESIDGREYYSFVSKNIEFHMISVAGGVGILDVVDMIDCDHTENIH
jgi:hypothetical protein